MSSCCDDDNNILPSSCFPTAGSQAEGVQAWRQAWIPVILQGLRSPDEHLRHRVSLYGVPVPLSLDQASVLPLLQQVMALQAGQHAASDSQVPLPPTPPRAPPPPTSDTPLHKMCVQLQAGFKVFETLSSNSYNHKFYTTKRCSTVMLLSGPPHGLVPLQQVLLQVTPPLPMRPSLPHPYKRVIQLEAAFT